MAARPTVTDLVSWVGLRADPTGDTLTALNESMATALDVIEDRLRTDVIPDDATAYPQVIRTAVLLQAGRFFKRRATPEGVIMFGDQGGMAVTKLDPDVELMLQGKERLDGFA